MRACCTALVAASLLAGCESTKSKKSAQDKWNVPTHGRSATNAPARLTSPLAPAPEPDRDRVPAQSAAQDKSLSTGFASLKGTDAPPNQKLYSFSAKDLEVKDALALFARSNDLNIVPDPDITGQVTVDFRNLTLEKSMDAILDMFNYFAEVDRGLIRIRKTKTEFFTVDYVRLTRSGNSFD